MSRCVVAEEKQGKLVIRVLTDGPADKTCPGCNQACHMLHRLWCKESAMWAGPGQHPELCNQCPPKWVCMRCYNDSPRPDCKHGPHLDGIHCCECNKMRALDDLGRFDWSRTYAPTHIWRCDQHYLKHLQDLDGLTLPKNPAVAGHDTDGHTHSEHD
jgi:hypothetical protein